MERLVESPNGLRLIQNDPLIDAVVFVARRQLAKLIVCRNDNSILGFRTMVDGVCGLEIGCAMLLAVHFVVSPQMFSQFHHCLSALRVWTHYQNGLYWGPKLTS